MKKIVIIVFTVFLNVGLFSCTPTNLKESVTEEQTTGGEDGEILPEEREDDGDN